MEATGLQKCLDCRNNVGFRIQKHLGFVECEKKCSVCFQFASSRIYITINQLKCEQEKKKRGLDAWMDEGL